MDTHGCQGARMWLCSSPCSANCCRLPASCAQNRTYTNTPPHTYTNTWRTNTRESTLRQRVHYTLWILACATRHSATQASHGDYSRVGRRADGGHVVIGGVRDSPEVQVVVCSRGRGRGGGGVFL